MTFIFFMNWTGLALHQIYSEFALDIKYLMKKNNNWRHRLLNWDGCWLSSSAMVWPHTFFIFTCCVCILLAFYVYTFTSDILILLATSTLNKWIVYQNEENNVTPINPCLTSCTRLFDMLFIKIEIRHISNSCKISVKNWNWTLYLKIYFQFLFSFALTYYN